MGSKSPGVKIKQICNLELVVVYTCWKKQAHERRIFNPDPIFSFLGHKLIPVIYALVWLKNWTESQLQQ